MSPTEGLLIVIVIILTVMLMSKRKGQVGYNGVKRWNCVDQDTGKTTRVKMMYKHNGKPGCKCPKCSSPEGNSQRENAEYFTSSGEDPNIKTTLDCLCDPSDALTYSSQPFGSSGAGYNDWMTAQSVDPQVIQNHAEFVKDRLNEGEWTGRTYTPETMAEMEGSDLVPWVGIRGRPQATAICDPTQVPDYNPNSYTNGPKLTWNSNSSE